MDELARKLARLLNHPTTDYTRPAPSVTTTPTFTVEQARPNGGASLGTVNTSADAKDNE